MGREIGEKHKGGNGGRKFNKKHKAEGGRRAESGEVWAALDVHHAKFTVLLMFFYDDVFFFARV